MNVEDQIEQATKDFRDENIGGQINMASSPRQPGSTVKPITYLKSNAAELVREVKEDGRTVTITQNGEAKVVVMDVDTYDRWKSALALMKLSPRRK